MRTLGCHELLWRESSTPPVLTNLARRGGDRGEVLRRRILEDHLTLDCPSPCDYPAMHHPQSEGAMPMHRANP